MPKTSIHTKTASLEERDQYGKFTKLCHYLSKLSLKKVSVILAFISLIATNGLTLTIAEFFFPNSSPVFHRAIAHQGILKTLGNGQYQLLLPDNSTFTLYLKPSPNLNNLKTLNEVVVKGNLIGTPYAIENAEIYPVNISTPSPSPSGLPKGYDITERCGELPGEAYPHTQNPLILGQDPLYAPDCRHAITWTTQIPIEIPPGATFDEEGFLNQEPLGIYLYTDATKSLKRIYKPTMKEGGYYPEQWTDRANFTFKVGEKEYNYSVLDQKITGLN